MDNIMETIEFGLLTEEQVFGDHKSSVIEALGTRCAVTDYAVLSGARGVLEKENGSETSERTCKWALSTEAGYGDVCEVGADGSRSVVYAVAKCNVRPVLKCSDPKAVIQDARRDISGLQETEFGEYPQYEADPETAARLEPAYEDGVLRKTGKRFASEYEEFEYQDRKFIRMERETGDAGQNGASGQAGVFRQAGAANQAEGVWIEVSPVKWLCDEENGILVSRDVLAAGQIFRTDNNYDGNFKDTIMYNFLNKEFAKDLVPSQPQELTDKEKAEAEENRRRAEQRRNPYDLTFGQVTEEDIIRGAIESDIAVFLHGPSSEGKSARVKQIDPTCEIIYLRNATPDSLNGRSVYNQSTGEMIDIPPTWYKKVKRKCEEEPDTFHVVFFDEINNALPSIQGMAFNIVLDREVNGLWKLPDNARVVAAGNDMQDSLAANQIAAPFFNRFAHVYINTTTEKWLKWARDHQIHPAIYSYIAYKRGETLRSTYTGEKPNADPRKWEMASKMLYTTGRPEMLRALIGEEITDEFVHFCNQPIITLERVLREDYTDEEIDRLNTAQRYATTMGLSQAGEEDLKTVRAFTARLGEEFRAVFDELWAGGDKSKLEKLAKAGAR